MLKSFKNVFLCYEHQLPMFESLKAEHPAVYEDILVQVRNVRESHPSYVRDVCVTIAGKLNPDMDCLENLKSMEDYRKFSTFKVQDYRKSMPMAHHCEYITDSVNVHAE